jgi:hypothetical protein
MILDRHHHGYECSRKHVIQELGLKVIEDDHENNTKVQNFLYIFLALALSTYCSLNFLLFTSLRIQEQTYLAHGPLLWGTFPLQLSVSNCKDACPKQKYSLFFVTLHFKTIDCFLSIGRIFFEEIGQIADIRIATHPEGMSKGFAHVDFSTVEAAQVKFSVFCILFRLLFQFENVLQALKLNGKELMGRPLRLVLAANLSVQSKSKGMGRVAKRGFRKAIPEAEVIFSTYLISH